MTGPICSRRWVLKPFVIRLSQLARNRADHSLAAALILSIERPDYAIQAAQRAAKDGYVSVEGLFPMVDVPFSRDDDEHRGTGACPSPGRLRPGQLRR